MIFYSWIALGQSDPTARNDTDPTTWSNSDWTVLSRIARTVAGGASWADGVPVAMGITDDRGRAMKAGEETLGTGRAAVVIIEAVRPGMAAHTLAPCYVRTGVGWVGRPIPGGEVAWDRFFL
jgi:hypothetical protein